MSLFWKIRWWIYNNISWKHAWAVEVGPGEYQTFFALNQSDAEKRATDRFGSDAYLCNREWMA